MSKEDLRFVYFSNGKTVYDPLTLSGTLKVKIQNLGEEDLTNLGLYVTASKNLGDIDNPADYPPETDFQDLIKWGTSTYLTVSVSGGLKLNVPQNSGPDILSYVRRGYGDHINSKIPMKDIAVGEEVIVTLTLETPPSVSARRLFIDLKVF